LWILVGCYAFLELRLLDGLGWALWLVTVVVATDVAGYFAGRLIGGPKFWPRISPKKTWSGTAAGWVAAAIVGLIFSGGMTQAGWVLIPLSVAVSFASQMGDIAQSAAKRRKGIKDSSNLIPGHGGVFDRFDGMLGASVFIIPFWLFGAVLGVS
jgi:phosphatidate cytidylyltransferase